MIVNATGTRIFIDGTGAVTTQSIVGVASVSMGVASVNVNPSYVYDPLTGPFIDTTGWSLLLDGSVATPTGPAYSNVLIVQQSSNPSFSPAALNLNFTTVSITEFWQSGPQQTPYIDSQLVLPLVLTNDSSVLALALGNLPSSLLSAAAARQQASALPSNAVSSSLQLYFQYTLSIPSAITTSSPLWQVCASGTLTVDTTRGVAVEGSVRYPVTAASGTRIFTQYAWSYYTIAAGLINGSDSTGMVAATSVVQSITGVAPTGVQGADGLVAFMPSTAGSSFAINVTNDGLGLLLSSPAVYAGSSSWSPQVTLSVSTGNNLGSPNPAFALSEYWGPQSSGHIVGSTTSALSCPAAAVNGVATLAPPQTYLLVYSYTYLTSPASTSPAFSCLVAELTVAGLAVDTALGPASALLSVSGFHYATYGNGGQDVQPLNGSVSSYTLQLLYTSAQSPSFVDGNGLLLEALNDPNLYYLFYYNSNTNQYVERGNGGALSSNVYLLPASQLSAVPVGQAACSYSPTASVSSSSTAASAAASSAAGSSAPSAGNAASTAAATASTTSIAAASSSSTVVAATSTAASSSSAAAAQPVPSSTSASSGGGGVVVPSSSAGGAVASSSASVVAGATTSSSSSSSSSSSGAASSTVVVPPSSSSSSSSSSGLSHGAIAGIVIGSVGGALLILLICLVLLLLTRSGKEKQGGQTAPRSSDSSVVRPSVMAGEPSHVMAADDNTSGSQRRERRRRHRAAGDLSELSIIVGSIRSSRRWYVC